ncbi:MAG: protein kinase [Comamonadaceae bacterium]|nr:protein kinase [Comamonadaceae bacterium]
MGEVYLAQDVRLGRRVALKVLPAASAGDQDSLARFMREARAASALNHPNIITIHDIGDAAGTHFIACEFVDGTTLRDAARSAKLDVATVVDIGIQVASALAEAHRGRHRPSRPQARQRDDRGRTGSSSCSTSALRALRGPPTRMSRRRLRRPGRPPAACSSARRSTCRPSRRAGWRLTGKPTSSEPVNESFHGPRLQVTPRVFLRGVVRIIPGGSARGAARSCLEPATSSARASVRYVIEVRDDLHRPQRVHRQRHPQRPRVDLGESPHRDRAQRPMALRVGIDAFRRGRPHAIERLRLVGRHPRPPRRHRGLHRARAQRPGRAGPAGTGA